MDVLLKRGLLFLGCVVLLICSIPSCVSGIRDYYGLRDADYVDGNHLSALQEGEYVKVLYDCAFSGYMTRPSVMSTMEQFQRLRLSGSDKCILVCLDDATSHDLQTSGVFFVRTVDATSFTPKRDYVFAGTVEKVESRVREDLQNAMLHGMLADPEGVEKTRMEYYVHYIDEENAKGTMLKRYVWSAFWAMGCLFTLRRFLGRLRRIRYGGLQQQEVPEEETAQEDE